MQGKPSQRNKHIALDRSPRSWAGRRRRGYGRRALVETAMGRYKAIIGPRLRARSLSGQRAESGRPGVAVAQPLLNAGSLTPSRRLHRAS